jgi:hypothetical protein
MVFLVIIENVHLTEFRSFRWSKLTNIYIESLNCFQIMTYGFGFGILDGLLCWNVDLSLFLEIMTSILFFLILIQALVRYVDLKYIS